MRGLGPGLVAATEPKTDGSRLLDDLSTLVGPVVLGFLRGIALVTRPLRPPGAAGCDRAESTDKSLAERKGGVVGFNEGRVR